jgi:hypothetical protein
MKDRDEILDDDVRWYEWVIICGAILLHYLLLRD